MRVIPKERLSSLVTKPVACLALVTTHDGLAGLHFGSPQGAWLAASELSARTHIVQVDRPFRRVLPPWKTGGIDFSPLLLLFVVYLIKTFLSLAFPYA